MWNRMNILYTEEGEYVFVKILNSNKGRSIYKYHLGLNDTRNLKDENEKPFRIWFTDVHSVPYYLNYGSILAKITVPNGTECTISPEEDHDTNGNRILIPAFYTNIVYIKSFHCLDDIHTIKWLVKKGAVSDYQRFLDLYTWALQNSVAGFEFLNSWLDNKCSKDMKEAVLFDMQTRGYL